MDEISKKKEMSGEGEKIEEGRNAAKFYFSLYFDPFKAELWYAV